MAKVFPGPNRECHDVSIGIGLPFTITELDGPADDTVIEGGCAQFSGLPVAVGISIRSTICIFHNLVSYSLARTGCFCL
jgi:hypothetical protein